MANRTTPLKTCTKCGRELPATVGFFPRDATKRDGLRSHCRECDAARHTAYYAAHREEKRAQRATRYAAHSEEERARHAAYRAAHCEELRAYMVAYNAAHREERCAYAAAYRAAHLEERRVQSHNHRARVASAPGTHTAADVAAQYERQRGRCYWCSTKVGEAYHVDHVIPLSKGGGNGPENLVIACPACNQKKHAKHPMDFAGILC